MAEISQRPLFNACNTFASSAPRGPDSSRPARNASHSSGQKNTQCTVALGQQLLPRLPKPARSVQSWALEACNVRLLCSSLQDKSRSRSHTEPHANSARYNCSFTNNLAAAVTVSSTRIDRFDRPVSASSTFSDPATPSLPDASSRPCSYHCFPAASLTTKPKQR